MQHDPNGPKTEFKTQVMRNESPEANQGPDFVPCGSFLVLFLLSSGSVVRKGFH